MCILTVHCINFIVCVSVFDKVTSHCTLIIGTDLVSNIIQEERPLKSNEQNYWEEFLLFVWLAGVSACPESLMHFSCTCTITYIIITMLWMFYQLLWDALKLELKTFVLTDLTCCTKRTQSFPFLFSVKLAMVLSNISHRHRRVTVIKKSSH